jgi:hypothetical protein
MDAESRAGWNRGALAFGTAWTFFFIICVSMIFSGAHPGKGSAGVWVDAVGLAGFLTFGGLFGSIVNFNRPRFLVPPHLRGQQGAIAGRRRRRRDHLPMM